MATTKDPITGQQVDIGAQTEAAYQQDVLGAQARQQRIAAKNINQTLNADNLSSVQPMTLATPQIPTAFDGLAGSIEAQAQQYAQSIVPDEQVQEQKKTTDSLLSKLVSKISGSKGQTALESENYGEVDSARKELDDINNQILQEQQANRRQIEQIEKNPQGMLRGALEQEIQRVNKESISKQADLAVIQMAKQNNYSAAKEIADRKVAAQLEQQKIDLDALQFAYEENKEQFTKSEQRQFEIAQAERERLLGLQEAELKSVNDIVLTALQNGAPANLAQQAMSSGSREKAIELVGGYIGAQQAFENQLALAKFSEIDPQVIESNGRTVLIDRKTGQVVQDYGSSATAKPPTEGQLKAATFADRLMESVTVIDSIGNQFASPMSFFGSIAPNFLKSSERQQFEQAQRNFINAVLRRESGAVISEEEFNNARQQYFPQPGDSADVLRQKESNRNTVVAGMLRESGNVLQVDPLGITGETDDPLQLNFNNVGGDTNKATSMRTGMRTDRHNNPAAFTTDIAKLAGLKPGVDYVEGDPFGGGKYKTARLIGDPIAQTIKVIDKIGFYTQGGKPRWTYISNIPEAKNWGKLSYEQKKKVIAKMYSHEGGTQLKSLFS